MKQTLYELVLSPDFDPDHFVSETFRNPHLNSDPSSVINQLDSCHDRLKRALRTHAIQLHASLKKREELWQKTEGEIMLLKETVASLRASANKNLGERIIPYKRIQTQAKSLESCFSVLGLVRRSVRFVSELKKFRIIFPAIMTSSETSVSQIPTDACVKMAKSLEGLMEEISDLNSVKILQPEISAVNAAATFLKNRFSKDFRSAIKSGNFNTLVKAAKILDPLGALETEINFFIDQSVSESRGILVDGKIPAAISPAAEAAILEGATGRPVCQTFWEKLLSAISAEITRSKKKPDPKKIHEILKEFSAIAQANFSRVSAFVEMTSPKAFCEEEISRFIK